MPEREPSPYITMVREPGEMSPGKNLLVQAKTEDRERDRPHIPYKVPETDYICM